MILTRSVFSSYFVPATVVMAVTGAILKDTESQLTDEPQLHLSGNTDPTQKQLPEGQDLMTLLKPEPEAGSPPGHARHPEPHSTPSLPAQMTSWSSSTPCLHATRTPAVWGLGRRSRGQLVSWGWGQAQGREGHC